MQYLVLRTLLVVSVSVGFAWGEETVKARVRAEIVRASVRHGVDPGLAQAVAKRESGFQPRVVSPKGAVGVMQLMPGTALSLGVDPWNARQNIEGGVRYLASLLGRYRGNVRLALAAYNAGPGAVDRFGGVPPYAETRVYVGSVMGDYKRQGGSEGGQGEDWAKKGNVAENRCGGSRVVKGSDDRWLVVEQRRGPGCAVLR